MPSQGKIINAVNICLKQKPNIDFILNKTGVCAGLAALHIKYALENKTAQFFYLLDKLASLPSDYRIGENAAIDNFIIEIQKAFRPDEYSGYEILQGELEKILHIGTKPLSNEFNLGLITDESQWKELFKRISRDNRAYFIASKKHGISLSIQNGKYVLYDPNYNRETKEFDSAEALVTEIKHCFGYNDASFGLVIRVFAHPNATPEKYPGHDELHQIAFESNIDANSAFHAALALDVETLNYLFKEKKINYDALGKEYLCPAFNNLLVQQAQSPELKNALLRGVYTTLYFGNYKEAQKIIDHYLQTYTAAEEEMELKKQLNYVFSQPLKDRLGLMKKETDYSKLLKLVAQLKLSQEPAQQTNYNHLQLLTFIHQEATQETINLFLNKLSLEQIREQIQFAALSNQNHVLNVLINHLASASIDPKSFLSIFSKEVLAEIDATTLLRLLGKGFVINTQDKDLLALCMQRKDKSIVETYACAWAEQQYPELWSHIEKHEYHLLDLKTAFGSASLLQVLIFLCKNEHAKKAWQDDIPEELVQSALTTAILNGNKEMCLFLQEKLKIKKSRLDQDTLEFLYTKGLQDQDLSVLSLIAHLNFNVLHTMQDICSLLELCDSCDDFTIFEACFEKASSKIKQLILEYSLERNISAVIKICGQKEPQLFNTYLNDSIATPNKLARLNKAMSLLPPNILTLKLDLPKQKIFIKNCFKNKLPRIAKELCGKVIWEEVELNEFINELIAAKNEKGIILLLRIYPKLKDKADLVSLLAQNNLLKPIDFILTKERIIDHALTEQIFTAALESNYKNLVIKFLNQGRITPQTVLKQPLGELLKEAIKKGKDSILEPFIDSTLEFILDFKELFLFSCAQKKGKIANLLLAKEFNLSASERESAIKQLFGDQAEIALFETVYLQGYGRLYQLLLKSNLQHPRASLLSSIRSREHDPAFQQTNLYLNPLKRAIKEKNEVIFNDLFLQSGLPGDPDQSILIFLKDPILFPRVVPLFAKKYGLKKLLVEAIKHHEWAALANLIEKHQLSDLDTDLQQLIQDHGKEIVKAYRDNLETHYDKTDVRPQLFKLLDNSQTSALAQLAIPYQAMIQNALERIELNMLARHLDLNNQIYRHTYSLLPLKKVLDELAIIFAGCEKIIEEQKIDLYQFIENQELVNYLAQIKSIMAGHNITPYYLSDEQTELLEKLVENPRFKGVFQLEIKLFSLLKQVQKPRSEQNKANEDEFNAAIVSLHQTLEQAKLPASYVLLEIQPYLKAYQVKLNSVKTTVPQESEASSSFKPHVTKSNLERLKKRCTHAIDYYLKHRDHTLSYFSYFFDYYRGKIRAEHYKNLVQSAQSEQELYIIEYAILANSNGIQLKKDMATVLKFRDETTAKNEIKGLIQKTHFAEDLTSLDAVIDSINKKINANDATATDTLLQNELVYLKQIHSSKTPARQAFFQPEKQEEKTGFWQWIASWFGAANENRLGANK